MSITCNNCGFDDNPAGSEFCQACGSELDTTSSSTNNPNPLPTLEPIETVEPVPTKIQPPSSITNSPPISPPAIGTAKLISQQINSPLAEFPLNSTNIIIGRFDSDTGPVDFDLEGFPGEDTISRNHAEIYLESGQWKIKDLGSTNGVFIKRVGQTRFSARITFPETLNSGDEIAIAKIRFLFQVS